MSQKFCTECRREELRTGDFTVCVYCGGQLVPDIDVRRGPDPAVQKAVHDQIGKMAEEFRKLHSGKRGYSWDADASEPPKNPVPMVRDHYIQGELEKAVLSIEQAEKRYEDERRLKVVYVPERFLLEMYTFPTRVPDRIAVLDAEPPLPAGYEVLPGPHYDLLSRSFVFFVRHPSFDVVPIGELAPRWPSRVSLRMVRTVPDNWVSESSAPE